MELLKKRAVSLLLALVLLMGMMPTTAVAAEGGIGNAAVVDEVAKSFEGKHVSILSHSASTYTGVSNNAEDNSTIGNNDVYYTEGRHGVYLKDTWWQQTIDALGMSLLVNNSWSGSCVFMPRKGEASVGYGERAVNLHNDYTGEEPDVIFVYLGCNDFAYYKDTFGEAEAVDYSVLIQDNGDGSFTYSVPQTTCEAYAIMLHKVEKRYPNAEIYCMTSTARRENDYTGDSYPDAGQPTEYSAQLHKIAANFGYPIIDLENAIPKEVEIFDTYMGDKRAHPNALGMDQITNEVLSVMLGKDAEICHVISEDDIVAEQAVLLGGRYTTEVEVPEGYTIVVTMDGKDISGEAYNNGKVTIEKVTGDIEVSAQRAAKNFRWELRNDVFESVNGNGFSENKLNLMEGSISNGLFSGVKYALTDNIYLYHNKPWVVEWACTGNWDATLFANVEKGGSKGTEVLFRSSTDYELLALGEHDGSQYNNYGISIKDLDLDMNQRHVYRLENKVSDNGSMVWLYIDGKEIGPMNNHYIGSKNNTGNTSDWLSGKDFSFGYMGTVVRAINNCSLEYVEVWEEGEEEQLPMSLQYDDHMDITGKKVEIIDAGTPTSYQVGYGVKENTVLDTAVITIEGENLVATGIGTATIKIDNVLYKVTVEAAPISLLLLAGQSNMQGIDGEPDQSVICPDGQVYATYADRYKKTVEDVTKFVPSALRGQYSTYNVTGDTTCLEAYPVNMLTADGNGREGMDSGLAYEWAQQTGEKVWVVNLGYGGSSINGWLEGGEHFKACRELFSACQETLRKEISAGHFTLSHMGYFWCQGCADETQTAKWYADKFQTMHESFKTELAFDHDLDEATADKTMEFAAITPIRSGHQGMGSYRAGVYKDTTNVPYYQSFYDLRFNGPRVAQYWMGNNPELTDIWNVCTIQEAWATLPDGTDGVAEYFQSVYKNGTVDYQVQVQQSVAWYTPKTPAAVHDNIHYNQIGYNEIGRESARNTLIMLGELTAPDTETTVDFLTWDGFTPADTITSGTVGSSSTLVVPVVSPVYKSKEVTYSVTDGLHYDYYDLLTESAFTKGTLNANGAIGSVHVSPRVLTSYTWTFDGENLVSTPMEDNSPNNIVKVAGAVLDGQSSGIRYQADQGIQLLHDQEWALEIQISDWTGTAGSMILSSSDDATTGQPYIYFRPKDSFVGFGYYDGSKYHNHGISLMQYDIRCNEGTHVYRFVNHIADDGSNMVWLHVDDQQVAPLTDLYMNSTFTEKNNSWISGKDFVMPYFGTRSAPISGCVVDSILVMEKDYDPDRHIHKWSDWKLILEAGPKGAGMEERSCDGCGENQTQEVAGVWQTYDLDEHMSEMPENYCCDTNLWAEMEHDAYYYHSGERWDIHSSGKVYSVTIPVNAGDQIYATSFGKYGENGNTIGTGSGIRLTFFDKNGLLKTMDPNKTYEEFCANGGYVIAPEGAVAVNVPMYSNSGDNELYILNRVHVYKHGTCVGCKALQPGPSITKQPTNGEAKLGENYMIEVLAEGENLKYQWYFRNAGSEKWYKSGVRDNTYDDVMTKARAGREVYCVITDADGKKATTDTVKLVRLTTKLEITAQPVDATAVMGEMFCAAVEAQGEGLKYQWYFRNADSDKWYKSGVKDNTYDDIMTKQRKNREIYCVITDEWGNTVTTDTVKLIATPSVELQILTQPTDVYAAMGENYCVTVEAQGDNIKYQWYFRNEGSDKWYRSGVKDNTYDDVMNRARANREVYCVITDALGNKMTTDIVTLVLEK